jgi:hypothetical protein
MSRNDVLNSVNIKGNHYDINISPTMVGDGLSFDETERLTLKVSPPLNFVNGSLSIDELYQKKQSSTELKFYCIETVNVKVNGVDNIFEANTMVDIFLSETDDFSIETTSNKSISTLEAYPKSLGVYYDWLEGVNLFSNILFNMNNEELYTKWSQGNQGMYHVQFAQYKNCIFWSDLPYVSDVSKRTNYTLYYSSELPLCYSSIPDNTFKSFYFAYNVTCDPNWSNPVYKASFAKATWATQVFSYYGLHSIGLFDMDSTYFNITLPKDCRGLMYYAPNVLNAGVFDAINVTNFGAKSGSWRDAFGYCYQLTNLYIKNLKVNLNISWSPINQQSLNFILSKAANTNAITIYLSPHTYYGLTDANKTLATEKNITLSLIATNTTEDNRLHMLQMTGDGNSFLANDGTYKTIDATLETKVNEAITSIVGDAPETLNTLGELAIAIGNKCDIEHNHDEEYYSKEEVEALLSNYVSKDVVTQMIKEAVDEYFNSNPETPVDPEEPTNDFGVINEDKSISIDETQLQNDTYTLRYIDENDNIIENFNPITSFEINN